MQNPDCLERMRRIEITGSKEDDVQEAVDYIKSSFSGAGNLAGFRPEVDLQDLEDFAKMVEAYKIKQMLAEKKD